MMRSVSESCTGETYRSGLLGGGGASGLEPEVAHQRFRVRALA